MKPIRALLVYLTAVFAGAATIAPWVYRAVQAWAPGSGLAHQPFHRYVNRCLLGFALVGLFPLLRSLGIRSGASLGWIFPFREPRRLATGLAAGFLSLALAAAVPVIAGVRGWNPEITPTNLLQHGLNAALSAAVVSVLEECLFRGAVYGALRRVHGLTTATLVSALIYSLVHFFDRPPAPDSMGIWTGWTTLAAMLQGFTQLDRLLPGLLSLGIAGGLLAVCRERTGSLTLGIGMHAGWIFWLKSFGFLTRDIPGPGATAFWGTSRLYDGWPTCGILVAVALMLIATPSPAPALAGRSEPRS